MKKFVSMVLCLSLVMTFWGCGTKGETTTAPGESTETPDARQLTPKINSSTVIDEENLQASQSEMIVKGVAGGSTITGLAALPKVTFTVTENTKGLSNEKLSHSHGPSEGGEPHYTVLGFQKTFEKYGGLTLDTISEEKVLYLTFDCGYEHNNLTAEILDVLKAKKVPATFFCTLDYLETQPELVKRMILENHIVGNHSATHPSFPDISRSEMAKELQDFENYLRENFGYASKYFRFPAGEYSENALELVQSVGYVSVFWSTAYDDWDTSKIRGKDYAVEKVMSRLHDGAVILLHSVSQDNADALGEIIDKARAQGYEFRALTQYGT